ncbi:MAG: reverse transcriptase family protein [Pseudomonadota bacterium]
MPTDMPDQLSRGDARRLAALMLAQGWDETLMNAAVRAVWPDAPPDLVATMMAAWTLRYPPDERTLARRLEAHFRWAPAPPDLPVITVPAPPAQLSAFGDLGLPILESREAVADWFEITPPQLDWFADCQGRLARPGQEKFAHYTHQWVPKRTGQRLLEAPRPRLKALQRKVLAEILSLVPAHRDAFGFVPGRSCHGHAARHAGEQVVITVDLKDFFPSVPARRVHGIFRTLGYSHTVARLLTGLCTTPTPWDVLPTLPAGDRPAYRAAHLPQGAPTSPALANMAAYRLDVRLAALARRMGANYSRYADDLAFSGDRGLVFDHATPLLEQVHEIIRDEGFSPNPAKTRIMRAGRAQRVTGLTVNRHINVSRAEYDRLKATLTNCLRYGPASQNRDGHRDFRAHLEGRIAWVRSVNPRRAARLEALFGRIYWS